MTRIGTTGSLWVLQFFLFDRVLFRGRRAGGEIVLDQPQGPATGRRW